MKTPMQEFITFISSEDYKELYPSLKIEWFEIFLNKEKEQIAEAYREGYITEHVGYEKTISEYSLDYFKKKFVYTNQET